MDAVGTMSMVSLELAQRYKRAGATCSTCPSPDRMAHAAARVACHSASHAPLRWLRPLSVSHSALFSHSAFLVFFFAATSAAGAAFLLACTSR